MRLVVCRARHMFLKVSQTYHAVNRLTSLRPSRMEAKGVAVLQRGIGDGASEGSSPAGAGYRLVIQGSQYMGNGFLFGERGKLYIELAEMPFIQNWLC